MNAIESNPSTADAVVRPANQKSLRWYHILLIMLLTVVLAVGVTVWVIKVYIFPSEFKPVELSQKEDQALNSKLDRLDAFAAGGATATPATGTAGAQAMQPEAYSEAGARREIRFTERELNALLAKNTDLARKLAIDLSDNLVSAKLLVPMDPDFPILGGKTLKVRAGVELAYRDAKPIVILKGVSIMGVPIPNAWLGGLKNIDLVREFGAEEGFWKAFADGVENIQVAEGNLAIQLKE